MSAADVLLDRPPWAPPWFPSIDGGPGLRWLRRALVVVLVAGLAACVSEGANGPADPVLGPVAVGDDVTDGSRSTLCGSDEEDFGDETAALITQFDHATVTLTTGDESLELCVLVAATVEQRSRGLMTVTDFAGFDGMAFTYDTDSTGAYYMFNTPTPLTIYWFAADGSLVSSTDMEPCLDLPADQCPRYPPEGAYRMALEVPLGALDDVVDETTVGSIASG